MRIIFICLLVLPLTFGGRIEPVPAPHLTPPKQPSHATLPKQTSHATLPKQANERPVRSPQPQGTESNGLLSSFTQKFASWFWPIASQQGVSPANPEARGKAEGSATEPRGTWADSGRQKKPCSPCNSVPWVPIARAVNHYPQSDSHMYSLHVPTISVGAISSQYGPPKPEYGPPKPEYGPPKQEYGPPPKPEYGPPSQTEFGPPPKPDYGAPSKPEYGSPPQTDYNPLPKPQYGHPPRPDYGPPSQPDYGPPPKPQYGPPPKPDYGPPSQPDYGPPPKPQYGPPLQTDYGLPPKPEYGPPKPEYGSPPKPEYGPPKPEYGPPKPEYGPPKHEYGSPPKPEYGPPKPEYGPPKPEYGPPKPEYGSPPKPEYGPPKPEYGPPKPEYGPPSSPKPDYGSSSDIGLQPPKQEYNSHVQGWDSYSSDSKSKPLYLPNSHQEHSSKPHHGPPKHPGYLPPPKFRHPMRINYLPPKTMYAPPKPMYIPMMPVTPEHQTALRHPQPPNAHPNIPPALSYQQFLTPPPIASSDVYHSLQIPAAENFDSHQNQDSHIGQSNIAHSVTGGENPCSRCPPTGPDLSQVQNFGEHHVANTEEAKNVVGNFANIPLSDSAHEATNLASNPSPTASSIQVSPTTVDVTRSIPLRDYLSSIEYPMQIVQAPILDVPDLPKYFDLGYHSFHQFGHDRPNKNYHDSEKASTSFKPSTPIGLNHFQNHFHNPNIQDQTSQSGTGQVSKENNTAYEVNRRPTTTGEGTNIWVAPPRPTGTGEEDKRPEPTGQGSWTAPPRPFDQPQSNQTKIRQIIVPYSSKNNPPLARKVPNDPQSPYPDVQAIYLNRGVTAPGSGVQNINYPLTATGSENHDTLLETNADLLQSLPPDVMNHLHQLGITNQDGTEKSRLQQVLASDIRALLHGEQDTVDFVRLQKNIDKWTAEGYGKRDTITHQSSKKIPVEYLTTSSPVEDSIESDHEVAASQHYSHYKNMKNEEKSNETDLIEEVNGWALVETAIKTTEKEEKTTIKPWEKLQVSISPLTNEKVYVVTPQASFPTGSDNIQSTTELTTETPENGQRVTRDLVDSSTPKIEIVTPAVTESTETGNKEPTGDAISEMPASVTYLGSVSSLRNSRVEFKTR